MYHMQDADFGACFAFVFRDGKVLKYLFGNEGLVKVCNIIDSGFNSM